MQLFSRSKVLKIIKFLAYMTGCMTAGDVDREYGRGVQIQSLGVQVGQSNTSDLIIQKLRKIILED